MKSLDSNYYERLQKAKRSRLYKEMLDEQIKYNHQIKSQNHATNSPIHRLDPPLYHPRQNHTYLPAIHSSTTQDQDSSQKGNQMRLPASDDDRTEVYLSNCEEIIKNLRDLKNSRKKRDVQKDSIEQHMNNRRSIPYIPNSEQKPNNRYLEEVHHYPKPSSYFSTAIPYNKSVHQIPKNKIYIKKINNPLKPDQDPQQLPLKAIKDHKQAKITKKNQLKYKLEESVDDNPEENIEEEPTGLKSHKKSIAQLSSSLDIQKKRSRKIELKNQSIQVDSEKKQPQKELSKELSKEKEEEHQQLIICLKQLTMFLKNQNLESQKRKGSRVDLQTDPQAQIIALSIGANKEEEKRDQIQSNQNFEGEANPIQSIETNQEEFDQTQINEKNKQKDLKDAVLKGLKNLNKRGVKFIKKMGDFHYKIKDPSKSKPTHTKTQCDEEPSEFKQKQQNSDDESNNLENEELIDILKNLIREKNGQNHELIYCLKELTQYLKHQNEEIEEFRSSRISQAQGGAYQLQSEANLRQHKSVRYENPEERMRRQRREEENEKKMKAITLRRLKKAKMRGNLFTEKMEKYKEEKMSRRKGMEEKVRIQIEVEKELAESENVVNQQREEAAQNEVTDEKHD